MQDILEKSYGKRDVGFCNIVGGGFFGHEGDVVVDQIYNPKQVIGVSQGNGILKKYINETDQCNIDRINRELIN